MSGFERQQRRAVKRWPKPASRLDLSRGNGDHALAQTLYGSALLALKTGHHPALLKDAVTTPAGCTIEGLMELEKGGLVWR